MALSQRVQYCPRDARTLDPIPPVLEGRAICLMEARLLLLQKKPLLFSEAQSSFQKSPAFFFSKSSASL
jgi:hypothetical protein